MTSAEKTALADRLLGTSGMDDSRIADELGIEIEDLEEAAGDNGVCRCKVCDWWHEDGELDEEEVCADCGGKFED